MRKSEGFSVRDLPGPHRRPVALPALLLGIILLVPAIAAGGAKPTTPGTGRYDDLGLDRRQLGYPGYPVASGDPTGTRCGAAFAPEGQEFAEALAREDRRFGRLELVRVYFGGGPPEWAGSKADIPKRPVHVSFKYPPAEVNAGMHDAYIGSWFHSIPTDRAVFWTYFHEPENNIEGGEFTAAEYRAAWRRLEGIADQAGNRRLHATLTLMQWTVEPASQRRWLDYYPGPGTVDVLAWDVYNSPSQAARGEYHPPRELFDKVIAISAQQRLPWAVPEFGSHLAEGDDGTRRAAWLRATTAYAARHDALYVAYFDLDWPSGDYRLRDAPGISAWQDFCD